MTGTFGNMISASAELAMGYMDRLCKDISAEQFARLAHNETMNVDANHPAFILGHLAIYPSRIVTDLGGDASSIMPSEKDQELFSPAAKCMDDPDGSIYPAKDELCERFMSATKAAVMALQAADDSLFAVENPNEKMREKFPTIGAMHGFYVGGHNFMHIGQLSTWRRIMGMGPA